MKCMYDWLIVNLGLESSALRMRGRQRGRGKEGRKEASGVG